tara:strand:+ start:608 stop:799 length:192 start_codon:yes stop_codon:yes gene_type:complete
MRLKGKVGDLVCSRHDKTYHGVIMAVNPMETRTDHPNKVCRVLWFDGDETLEFTKVLEVLSEG